jgi:hypothetical protein
MTDQKPLRLWPGVMFAVSMLVLYFVAPLVLPDVELPVGLMGVLIGAVGVFFWWLFFSRAPWVERIGAVLLMIVAVIVTRSLVHPSISGAGQGMLMYILPIPVLMLALVIWAAATRQLRAGPRRATLAVAIALACVPFLIIRTDGVSTLSLSTTCDGRRRLKRFCSRKRRMNRSHCRQRQLPLLPLSKRRSSLSP